MEDDSVPVAVEPMDLRFDTNNDTGEADEEQKQQQPACDPSS